jgi:hypothetical protein
MACESLIQAAGAGRYSGGSFVEQRYAESVVYAMGSVGVRNPSLTLRVLLENLEEGVMAETATKPNRMIVSLQIGGVFFALANIICVAILPYVFRIRATTTPPAWTRRSWRW